MSRDVDTVLYGHPYRAIIRLAWPATVSMLIETLFMVVDAIWVGRLGAGPIAAVISASFVVWILMSLTMVLTTGVVAMISRALGGNDRGRAQAIAQDSCRFALLFGAVITVAGVAFREPIIGIMRLDPEVARLSASYLGIYLGVAFLVVFVEWSGALFRASGNMRAPLMVFGTGIGLNIILDPLLIFGIGPFPAWGVDGAAAATAISFFLTAVIFIVLLRQDRLPFRFRFSLFGRMDWRLIGRLVRIGIPISLSSVAFCVVYLFVNRITAGFGTEAVAALGIGNRIESVNYLISFGFSMAVATLVGQNLGAGNPERAASLVRKTILIISVFTGFMTVLFLAFPEAIVRIFVDDPAVITAGKSYIRILALSQILMGWELVLEGAFAGAGDTMPPMIISIPGSIIRIPLAWWLAVSLGWGVEGIWWTITISTIVKGVALLLWFSRGHWKTKQV